MTWCCSIKQAGKQASKQRKSIRQPRDDFDSRPTVVVVTHSTIRFSAMGQTDGYQSDFTGASRERPDPGQPQAVGANKE